MDIINLMSAVIVVTFDPWLHLANLSRTHMPPLSNNGLPFHTISCGRSLGYRIHHFNLLL